MKLPLQEPLHAKYLYISPDNIVHVFMPVVSGTNIGLDNTCKAVYSLQEFFGKGTNSNTKATLKGELLAYQEALERDLSLLGAAHELTSQKEARLVQIKAYLAVILHLENHTELNGLNQVHPSYPRPLESLMQDRDTSNLYSMVLRPSSEDPFLRTEATNPIFSVAHASIARNKHTTVSPLQEKLIQAYGSLHYEASDLKSRVIQAVLATLQQPHVPVQFDSLRQILTNKVEALLSESVDFTKTQQGTTIKQADIDTNLLLEASDATPTEYIKALLGYCAPTLFDTKIESPFNTLTTADSWSIATQFLLGITNIYAVTQDKISSSTNFGSILDSNAQLSHDLAATLAKAQKDNKPIEEACFAWINNHTTELQLKSPLSQEDSKAIQKTFIERYAEIKESPCFDEFFILDTKKKGSFFVHQGSICASFAKFAGSPVLDLPQKLIQPLETALNQESTLSTEISHQNAWVVQAVEINTTNMDEPALQTLYERIITYRDATLKKQLLTQLKQERPDFKPKIDAKQFLQHVAYGEQDEAEALLKQDPELAQALLLAYDIPFTDFAGRTFTCTAYEKAYWDKDTHMQRMLEKYILQNEETRVFIATRIQAIEALVSTPPASGMFEHPKPRGLVYTTKDKQDVVIKHQDTGFDLRPLINALNYYVAEYDKKPKNKTEEDWGALEKIWIEEVGRAQRDIPAHIAHEYCHPERTFSMVNRNKSLLLDASNPANLKRQLKFYNYDTDNHDVWFSPNSYLANAGLGFSFGIYRGWRGRDAEGIRWEAVHGAGSPGLVAALDSAALATIDEVRTKDREQSLLNLSQPLNLHAPQSQGL